MIDRDLSRITVCDWSSSLYRTRNCQKRSGFLRTIAYAYWSWFQRKKEEFDPKSEFLRSMRWKQPSTITISKLSQISWSFSLDTENLEYKKIMVNFFMYAVEKAKTKILQFFFFSKHVPRIWADFIRIVDTIQEKVKCDLTKRENNKHHYLSQINLQVPLGIATLGVY